MSGIITLGEFVAWRQPEMINKLFTIVIVRSMEQHPFEWWKDLMETAPGFEPRKGKTA